MILLTDSLKLKKTGGIINVFVSQTRRVLVCIQNILFHNSLYKACIIYCVKFRFDKNCTEGMLKNITNLLQIEQILNVSSDNSWKV